MRFLIAITIALDIGYTYAESLNDQIIAKSDGDLSIATLTSQESDVNAV